MRKRTIAGLVMLLLAAGAVWAAEEARKTEMPAMPAPTKQHEWLKQLAGEWDADVEMTMDPSQPPTKSKGSETSRMLGGFWLISEFHGDMMGMPFTGVMTVGYNPDTKKYVATWVDSAGSRLWTYEGSVDEAGKALTLETEGPCPMAGGKTARFREVLEIKSKDHNVFTSSVELDGKWMTPLTINYKRKSAGTRPAGL
jgi:hypothetical protein